MKRNSLNYAIIQVERKYFNKFLQEAMEEGIIIWNVINIDNEFYEAHISIEHLPKAKEIAQQMNITLKVFAFYRFKSLIKYVLQHKALFIAGTISILFLFMLANLIWSVKINGVSFDIKQKIEEQLKQHDIMPLQFSFTKKSSHELQTSLLQEIPELLWIGVEKKGTRYQIEAVEKSIVPKAEETVPSHLVATKKGVIKRMEVSKGFPEVRVNDYVTPGKKLVSGVYEPEEEKEPDEEEKDKDSSREIVGAEGKIIARTWYEMKMSIPLEINYERLTGAEEKKYYLQMSKLQLPIWNFKPVPFEQVQKEDQVDQLHLFHYKLPLYFMQTTIREKEMVEEKRTKSEAIELGIEYAKVKIKSQLGIDAEVISEKVLHESLDNGKVNLHLFITVEEDIAMSEPVT